MEYKVVITPPARHHLDLYIGYTANILRNKQAAKAIREDARQSKQILSTVADSIKLCSHPILNKWGYRKLSFQKHRFIMLYRMDYDANRIVVEGMYHELQDYESLFIDEMNLS